LLKTDGCLRMPLSEFMDGVRVRCSTLLGAEKCSNCHGARKHGYDENFVAHSSKRSRYSMNSWDNRTMHVRERMMEQGFDKGEIEGKMAYLKRCCLSCYARHNGERQKIFNCGATGHRFDDCMYRRRIESVSEFEILRMPENSECHGCGLPGDWCVEYRSTERCQGPNMVARLCSMMYSGYRMKFVDICGSIAERKIENRELNGWLSTSTVFLNANTHNMFVVFCCILDGNY
jgi:hypothetical protein